MDTRKMYATLAKLLKDLRALRTEASTDLDILEDQLLTTGPVIHNGGRNEELKQSVDALRRLSEEAMAAVRVALTTVQQLEAVAQRYTADGIKHPIVHPPLPEAPAAP